jgi:hypothetical protein
MILTGLMASTFCGVSVAFLLDFAPSRTCKIVLWFLIIFQIIALLTTKFIELFQCRPVRAFWEVVPGEKCNTPSVMWTLVYGYAGSSPVSLLGCIYWRRLLKGIGILGDLRFAIMPMFLIWRLVDQ